MSDTTFSQDLKALRKEIGFIDEVTKDNQRLERENYELRKLKGKTDGREEIEQIIKEQKRRVEPEPVKKETGREIFDRLSEEFKK